MRTLRWWMVVPTVWVLGCSPESGDKPSDASTSDGSGGAVCSAGQTRAYAQGCSAPTYTCVTPSCGDAAAFPVCGCNGQTFTVCGSMLAGPDRPWAHAGPCGDGGS